MKRSNEDQQDHAVKRSQPTMLHNGSQLPVSPNLSAGSPSPPRKKEVRPRKRRVDVERLASLVYQTPFPWWQNYCADLPRVIMLQGKDSIC